MSDGTDTDGITIEGEAVTLHASEKVSVREYESATTSLTVEASLDGADLNDGIPKSLHKRLHGLQHELQQRVKTLADTNRSDDRTHGGS